ncbi:aspartate kinase [Clostridium botulinum]
MEDDNMTMVEKKKLERLLKKFNDDEMGGGYLYFLHREGNEEMLVQLDLVDYSSINVCPVNQILNVEFVQEDDDGFDIEGLYIKLEEVFKGIDSCWIDENGCQF